MGKEGRPERNLLIRKYRLLTCRYLPTIYGGSSQSQIQITLNLIRLRVHQNMQSQNDFFLEGTHILPTLNP